MLGMGADEVCCRGRSGCEKAVVLSLLGAVGGASGGEYDVVVLTR